MKHDVVSDGTNAATDTEGFTEREDEDDAMDHEETTERHERRRVVEQPRAKDRVKKVHMQL